MAGNRRDWHYAMNVHEQDNPNAAKRNHWSGLDKAVSWNAIDTPVGSGSSSFTDDLEMVIKNVKKTKSNPMGVKITYKHNYNYPYIVAAYQFGLNIPDNAYIYKITFKVCMKVAKGVTAKAPKGIANIYGSAYYNRRSSGGDTGWVNGYYHMQPNVKLSTSWKEVEYTLTESVVNEGGFTPTNLNSAIMGIDLNFTKCGNTEGKIYIKWAGVDVEYDVPDHQVSLDIPTSPDYPHYVKTGDTFRVGFWHINSSKANDVPQHYHVKTPGFGYEVSNDSGVTDTWVVPGEGWVQHWLWFTVKSHILGLNSIEVGGRKFWFYSLYGKGDDYYVVRITPSILRKAVSGCIQVNAHVWDEDGIVTFNVTYAEGHPNPAMNFNLNSHLSSPNVSVRSITADSISLSIPPRTECDVCFDVCAVPYYSGVQTFKLVDDDGDVYTQQYNVLPAYTYRFCNAYDTDDETFDLKFLPTRGSFELNRFLTQTELGMYELDSVFNEETMYITECGVTASKFDELDYVGCVPLTHSHFDPKSDYTDTLLNETFKNKTYMGKKGVIDETITLNLRVPPRDVTTLQGLVEMDKPVPINTNHTAFEGDALNHRGWVELYGVKDVEKTNPNYYKISLDVKYLTHNIAYKFDILRHSKILPDIEAPNLFVETLSFDDPLSNGLRVEDDEGNLIESSDFFDVDTDGTYRFFPNEPINNTVDDPDVPVTEVYSVYNADFSNLFNLGEGQHVRITSHKVLSQNVKISCNWKSNKQGTTTQNNSVKRVFRIRDAMNTENVLFEYTYYDFSFDETDLFKAHVTSTYTGTDDNLMTLFNSEIAVRSDNDYNGDDDDDENGELLEVWYGSKVNFELKGNHLTVTDEGYNGRELNGSCDLKTGSYIFECEFTNVLNQSYVEDCFTYIDMEVYDTFLQSDYAATYSNLVVSPFPVVNKKVLFTRQSEEGTIYYMYDDGKPFKYLLEPYYQYHCGVDLKSREGISLFNLDNRYSIFYMQNGLVRIGFNRIDGEVYLSKYDPTSGEYIPTNTFKLNADVKFEKGVFNDDKIEILADTMVFTMWRGHPYVMVNHPHNDIEIKSIFTKVFGETSEGGMPSLYNLMNEDNLLAPCVGGADISSDCIQTVANYENIVEAHTITVNPLSNLDVSDDEVDLGYTFDDVSNDPSVASQVKFVVNGSECAGHTYVFNKAGVYVIYAVYLGDDLNQYKVSPEIKVDVVAPVTFPDPEPTPTPTPEDPYRQTYTPGITGKFEVTCDTPNNKHFGYRDKQQIRFTLTRGGTPIAGKILNLAIPTGSVLTGTTDASGQVVLTNDWEITPRKEAYYVMASFNDQVNEDDDPQTLYRKQIAIFIDKQKSTLHYASSTTSFKKGQSVKFELRVNDVPRSGYSLQVKSTGVSTKKYKTNDKGQINVKLNSKGLILFEVTFAGTAYKTSASIKQGIGVS